MEAFVVLMAECLVAPLLAGLVVLLEAVFALLTGLAHWIAGSSTRKKSGAVQTSATSKFLKRTTIVLLGLLTVTLAGTFVINTFWFEPAARFVLEQVEQRKKIKVTFSSASGNLFTGKIELHDAVIERTDHPISTFSLKANHIDGDLNMWQIIQRKPVLDYLHITGLTGNFKRIAKANRIKPRREFRIRKLSLEDVFIKVKDLTRTRLPVDLEVRIDTLESKPFRSTHMIYDALLRSTAKGTINDSRFNIGGSSADSLSASNWNLERLHLDRMGNYLIGDWNFIEYGFLDIDVKNTFSSSIPAEVNMRWRLSFSDIHVRRPGELVKRFARVRDKIEDYLEQHGREFSFEFSFTLSEDQFINRPTLEAAGVWEKFREKFAKKAALMISNLKEKTLEKFDKVKQRFPKLFKKKN